MKNTGLNDFQRFFASFIGIITAGTATTALVLMSALAGIAPPWPASIIQITAIAQLLVLIFTYQMFAKAGKKRIERLMTRAAVGLVLVAVTYLAMHSAFVFEMPNGEMGMKGVICSTDAHILHATKCPFLSDEDIAAANFDVDKLYTTLGILISRIAMLLGWVLSLVFLIRIVAAFVVYQRRMT